MSSRITSTCAGLLLLLPACGGGAPMLGEPGDLRAVDRTIEVEADEFDFSMDEIEVAAGETVAFVITNVGEVQHEFSIGAGHAHHDHADHVAATGSTGVINPGDSASLVWAFPAGGETQFACHIDAHDELGMVGTLSVST